MAETTLTVKQIMDLGLWSKVCEYKGWDEWILSDGKIDDNTLVTFDSEFNNQEVNDNPFCIPESLEEMINELELASQRYDFSDEYIIENDLSQPCIGEYVYGTSFVPCSWVLPYLHELRKLKG